MSEASSAPRLEHVDWLDPRAEALREAMNIETSAMYASRAVPDQDALDSALAIEPSTIVATVLVTLDGVPVGHAALRPWGDGLEVKKVFVDPAARGTGVSRLLMGELETIARARGAASLILQTGNLQHAAIALYLRMGYVPVPVYGAYGAIPFALCYEKVLG